MDIKNALNSILPLNTRAKDPVDRSIKMGNTTDRDANGQQQYSQQESKREPMSDEQFEKAVLAIKSIPAIKDLNLSVESIFENGKRFVLLRDTNGQIIRRLSEYELWDLPSAKEGSATAKGQLIKRTA